MALLPDRQLRVRHFCKIAENIRALRREKGLTQEQLAGVLGVTTGAVYKLEAGLSQPEAGMLAGTATKRTVPVLRRLTRH